MRLTRLLSFSIAAAFVTNAFCASAKPADRLNADDARHLLNRTGFSASASEVATYSKLTRAEAVDRLLAGTRQEAETPPPAWVSKGYTPKKYRDMSREEQEVARKLNLQQALELREWWLGEMLTTSSPFTEKMTLFWHNHFATSQQKVKYTLLMYNQNVLLRKHALGNFGGLLHQMARNPAMLIYLDNAKSRKEQPNENFAREVMELFTLGEGNYTERDIKEMARAFTGWSLDRETGQFMFRRGFHDNGEKTIFGKTGNFEGDQALDLLLKRPETAQFITRKLWREFVSPTPDENEVTRLAAIYRDSGYSNAKLMRAMLTSDAFYATDNRASLIKSPVEFVVGTMKQFEIDAPNLRPFVLATALLGQNIFTPPNVKGWPGGETWINSATLLGRKQFIDRLFKNEDRADAKMMSMEGAETADKTMMAKTDMDGSPAANRQARQQRNMERGVNNLKWNLDSWSKAHGESAEAMSKMLLAVAPRTMPASTNPADWARAFVTDPAYQLK